MSKIVIIGSNGQLGNDIYAEFKEDDLCAGYKKYDLFPLTHVDIEVTSIDSCKNILYSIRPDIIINTSAFHNVDLCEQNPIVAYQVNALGPRNLAIISNDINAQLVHISTDYVFGGVKTTPYQESDLPNPLNVYGNTKLSGEYFVRNISKKYYIFRTSALYGTNICRSKNAPNFVDRMIQLSKIKDKLKVVTDEIVSPTSTFVLAKQIHKVIMEHKYGLYHATSQGECSWYEFTKFIFEQMKIITPVETATSLDFPVKINRPFYSVLDNKHLRDNNLDIMPDWKKSVIEYLGKKYG